MSRQKFHRDRVYQVVGEPGVGSAAVGYVRYSSELQDPTTIVTQKRRIQEYADTKGWKIVHWYEEPEQSAKYEEIDKRPVFAQLLNEAGIRFQIVLCYMNNRWSRNVVVAYTSLTRLRRARIWWATSDGLWDIDKVQQDGFDVAFAVDTQMNASYVRQLSKRTIDGKEDRARDGYHNGWVPFGYLPPEYPKAPDGAPSTWRPPRMSVRSNPLTFPALVRIGELAAQGWTDRAIADELEGYMSVTARFGERMLSKDTVAAIRRSWFPREFVSGCGHGTIETPSGELVEGRHQAAWPYELWQRMQEVKMSQYRRPSKVAQRNPHEFSRIIVCVACRRPLRVASGGKNAWRYYRDSSSERKLPCSASGSLSVRSSVAVSQFGDILRGVELPGEWRQAIIDRCMAGGEMGDTENGRAQQRRKEIEAEQKRIATLFTKGYITEEELDEQMGKLRSELFTLPVPKVHDGRSMVQEAIGVGETLGGMVDYWNEALPEEKRDIVWSLLQLDGLVYDLERQVVVGLRPRDSVLAVLALGLEATGMWEQRNNGLWLKGDYWPPKIVRDNPHSPPPQVSSMTPAQQERAIMLIRQGMSLRQVAKVMGTSYQSVYRLVKREGIVLQPDAAKLTSAQLEDARRLLGVGWSQRRVAKQLGVSHETLRRSLKRVEH